MTVTRPVGRLFQSRPTIEGAGVHLKRAFGFNEAPLLDPFLLLDDFHSHRPEYYLKGFPWHPHRGIETITYVLEGRVDHGDSLGNQGVIQPGDVQWMTAGSGIIHQEMPAGDAQDRLWGFQLWANLPADHKMMPPRYREIKAHQIPTVRFGQNVEAKIIAGQAHGVAGPVTDIVIGPQFLDLSVGPETEFFLPVQSGHKALAYVIQGQGSFQPASAESSRRSVRKPWWSSETATRSLSRPAGSQYDFSWCRANPSGNPLPGGGPLS